MIRRCIRVAVGGGGVGRYVADTDAAVHAGGAQLFRQHVQYGEGGGFHGGRLARAVHAVGDGGGPLLRLHCIFKGALVERAISAISGGWNWTEDGKRRWRRILCVVWSERDRLFRGGDV